MKEYFYTITEGMINLGLRGTELNLFAIIFGYSQKGDGCCYATRRELARRCGVSSTNTIDSAMASLIKKGLVRKFTINKEGQELVTYAYTPKIEQGTQNLSTHTPKIGQEGYAKIGYMKNKEMENKDNIFIPPTPQEVAAYVRSRGFADPEGFADYYIEINNNRNWRMKSGKEITNWKNNIVSAWEKNHKDHIFRTPQPQAQAPTFNDFVNSLQ